MSQGSKKLNILICGLGSIGKRHARLLREHFPHQLFALRTYLGQEKNDLRIPELLSWEEVDRHSFDAAFITNPTYLHIATALECASRRMHLFVEKPIDCKREGLDDLLRTVKTYGLATYVAYPLRFDPVIREAKKILEGQKILHARALCASYLPEWRSGQDHLKNYSAFRNQGGGVILDLSHEIDYAAFLFGEIRDLRGIFGKVSSVTVDSEDFADMTIFHDSSVTNVHLNYFSRYPRREIFVDTEELTLRADILNHKLEITKDGRTRTQHFSVQRDDMYLSQLKYFFDHLDNTAMENDLSSAGKLFEKILTLKERNENFTGTCSEKLV